ncbi:MAG: hypothetical protein ACK5RC_06960 [Curvibacter sp.]|jgi:hypothetical protein|nr:hypothetical protein [Curvibacter sp.]
MLDTDSHQAAGLAALAAEHGPRIVALAGHGDRRSELPLLWQLCAAWTALEYPVLVLDAHVRETVTTPGLQQMLASTDAPDILPGAQEWPIVPAATGLTALGTPQVGSPAAASAERARALCKLFHGYELIVLYAPAHELARSFCGSALSPLLAVSAQEAALLSAYHALKHLLNLGKLRPTIVSVMDDTQLATRVAGHSISRNLQDCARDFLACEVPALTVCPAQADDMQRIALRSMEQALQPPRWNPAQAVAAGATLAARRY